MHPSLRQNTTDATHTCSYAWYRCGLRAKRTGPSTLYTESWNGWAHELTYQHEKNRIVYLWLDGLDPGQKLKGSVAYIGWLCVIQQQQLVDWTLDKVLLNPCECENKRKVQVLQRLWRPGGGDTRSSTSFRHAVLYSTLHSNHRPFYSSYRVALSCEGSRRMCQTLACVTAWDTMMQGVSTWQSFLKIPGLFQFRIPVRISWPL